MINQFSKEEIVLSRDSKELFVQRFVRVFLSKSKAGGGVKSKNKHHSRLYILWYDCQKQPSEVFYKKAVLKISQYSQKTPALESIFNTNYFEKHPQTVAF